MARQWLLLRKTQELANMKAKVVADADVALVASNVHAPPPPGVCCSPSEAPPSCAPAPELQELGFADLNADATNDDDDDCAELECDDDDVVPLETLSSGWRGADIRDFGNNFAQAALDWVKTPPTCLNQK